MTIPVRVLEALVKWRWPLSVGFALAVGTYGAIGFGWPTTPRAQLVALARVDSIESSARMHVDSIENSARMHVDSVVFRRLDSLIVRQGRGAMILEGLGRVTCQGTPYAAATAGIPCRELLGGR